MVNLLSKYFFYLNFGIAILLLLRRTLVLLSFKRQRTCTFCSSRNNSNHLHKILQMYFF